MMMHGQSPIDMPFVLVLQWEDESLDDYIDYQIDIQQVAIEKALANFWSEING